MSSIYMIKDNNCCLDNKSSDVSCTVLLIGSWQEYFWIQRIWILLQEETQRWQLHYWLDPAHLEEMVFTNYVRNQTILNNCNIDVFFHISCSSKNFPCFYLGMLLVESCSSSDMICNWFLMCTLHFFCS